MARKKSLPKELYVCRQNAGTEDEYLQADTEAIDLVDGFDKPTEIGVYELKKVVMARKELKFIAE